MYQSFWVNSQELESVKKEIRSLSSLRFKGNPVYCGNKVNICLTGEVEDSNRLNQKLEEGCESPRPQSLNKKESLQGLIAGIVLGVLGS